MDNSEEVVIMNRKLIWGVTNSVIAYADADFRMTYVGGSESHNNLQPYMVVYIWVRTA